MSACLFTYSVRQLEGMPSKDIFDLIEQQNAIEDVPGAGIFNSDRRLGAHFTIVNAKNVLLRRLLLEPEFSYFPLSDIDDAMAVILDKWLAEKVNDISGREALLREKP